MNLSIDRLRTLALIARTGSLSGAARELGVGVSAASQQIANLEQEIGQELLVRSIRPARLTPLGISLAAHGAAILEEYERAVAACEQSNDVASGRFDIAAIPTIAVSVVTKALLELQQGAPELDVRVHDLEAEQSLKALATHDLDLSVVDLYDGVPMTFPDDITAVDLGSEPVQVFAPKSLLDGNDRPTISLEDLAHLPFVSAPRSASCGAAAMRLCRIAGFEPDIKLETNDLLLLRSFIENGFGVTILPRLALPDPPPSCAVLDLEGNPSRKILALSRNSTRDRPSEQAFIDALKSSASIYLEPPKDQA